jgi:multidrug transporter EmrE-like cation transporter
MMLRQEPALAMMMSLYVTLGIFLLLAVRNPSAHRSLIAFAAWLGFAHAGTMAVQVYLNIIPHREMVGVLVLVLIGIALIALSPTKEPAERISAVAV